jgi:hypothetical protein
MITMNLLGAKLHGFAHPFSSHLTSRSRGLDHLQLVTAPSLSTHCRPPSEIETFPAADIRPHHHIIAKAVCSISILKPDKYEHLRDNLPINSAN